VHRSTTTGCPPTSDAAPGLVDRQLRDGLRLRPGHENTGTDGELEAAERRAASEVLERDAARTLGH